MKIRSAKSAELKRLIHLEMTIIRDMQTSLYQELGSQRSEELLYEASALDPLGRYNYRRALVAEVNGEIAGIAYGFPGEEERTVNLELDKLTQEKYKIKERFFPDPEVFGEEWYLDSLVVDPKFQNQGIGFALLENLCEVAKKAKKNVIGLNVDDNNPRAKKLYLRAGFSEVNRIKIGSHDYTHMHKTID
jgi:uncharacterized protein